MLAVSKVWQTGSFWQQLLIFFTPFLQAIQGSTFHATLAFIIITFHCIIPDRSCLSPQFHWTVQALLAIVLGENSQYIEEQSIGRQPAPFLSPQTLSTGPLGDKGI